MADIVNRVVPIVLLLGLGLAMRAARFITAATVADLRRLVVTVALPAVLFVAFLGVDLEPDDVVVVGVVFGLCSVLYLAGRSLRPAIAPDHEYFPFLMSGFEAGMLGISLFGSAYGISRVGAFAVVDLGHELFIWFVLLALLLAKRDGVQHATALLGAFLRSPVIVAILTGIAANLLGLGDRLYEWPLTGGVMNTLDFLAGLTVPLILLIIGFGLRLDVAGIRTALVPVATRLAMVLPLAIVLPPLLRGNVLNDSAYAEAALFTLLVLPPPFIIPLYMREGESTERRYVNNALSLHTVVSVLIFVVYLAIDPIG
jgi:predicted permease